MKSPIRLRPGRSVPRPPSREPRPASPWPGGTPEPPGELDRVVRVGRARLNVLAPWRRKESS